MTVGVSVASSDASWYVFRPEVEFVANKILESSCPKSLQFQSYWYWENARRYLVVAIDAPKDVTIAQQQLLESQLCKKFKDVQVCTL